MNLQRTFKAYKFGIVNYLSALKLQERLSGERKTGNIQDTVLSLQHPPTYTLGKRRTDHNLLVAESELQAMGAELHYTERGGDITFHGPRQAIIYPIISLRAIGFGARKYVEGLESIMIEVASFYGVNAHPGKAGETGVWVGDRKIGAMGVRISSDKGVTSLREALMQLPADEVIHDQLIQSFAKTFHFKDIQWCIVLLIQTSGGIDFFIEMHTGTKGSLLFKI